MSRLDLSTLAVLVAITTPAGRGATPAAVAESPQHAVTAAARDVLYYDFDPFVVDPDLPEPVELVVQADGSVGQVTVELAAGTTLPLAPLDGDRYAITLTPDQVLHGYGADDVQHNFVGFLDTHAGGARLGRRNLFINVADAAVPRVPVEVVAEDMQATAHIAAIHMPGRLPSEIGLRAVAQRFYSEYGDDYDFLNVVSTPPYNGNRFHLAVRNDVSGIGLSTFDDSAQYGSAGRLLGINRYPIPGFFDLAEQSAMHETGHQWINFLEIPTLEAGIPHWPISSLAPAVMGYGRRGGQGLSFPFEFEALGRGEYRLRLVSDRRVAYADLELYLMGLLPAEEVGAHFSFPDQDQVLCDGCVLRGAVPVGVQDVIDAYGPRRPAYPVARRAFSMATIVVSTLRPLTPRELAFFDYFAARGGAREPLPYTSGFARGTALPFFAATGGRGTLSTALGPRR